MGKELQRHSTPKVLSVMANIVKLLNCCIVESQFSIYELATSRAPLIIIIILGPIVTTISSAEPLCKLEFKPKTKTNIVLVCSIKYNRWSNLARLHKT